MDLFLAAIQVVPMLFISLFLDRNTATAPETKYTALLRLFHLLVTVLGLIAFSLSVYIIGSETEPASWMRSVVTSALACAMGALSAQILLRLTARPSSKTE
ncbi:hypothetical protein [Microbacterium lacticum]|uniref:Uncharacterized protein n=1 Tax=Microbacterium lacticum TaxID=33885 RepID=A0A4Y3UR43_9MICO|nr:hypothetical protein [Microbacterium lacticum]TQM98242.1 hypothetical protein FHX68_2282 [Microbacterium lacticum]GEB95959.1 hypothetical protein MLA01_21780 [Microbacterium lacticum]GGI70936.1 hypothetical protein GCM10009724_22220 [Microbacterium lacticum]